MDVEIGEVIAKRSFEVIGSDGTISRARALLGKPQRIPDTADYFAPWVIEGLGNGKPLYGAGIDGFQAIHIAVKMIDVNLAYYKRIYNVEIKREGDNTGGLGFLD